ncbi:polymorphic toxin type 50 domain-containing protein [Selenomonas sputigena]|uniref:polymorphic toxin type 50 domain-containing protein n=1 Tax=Selenomonas sputigena TaxID=69823 RepID=UPI0028EF3101|nr:polymorphic toxin type 50 domain-containing protein [Selenomonas sputigena]
MSAGDFKFDLQLFTGGKIPDKLLDGSPYNLTIRRQVQNRHIPGTKEYDRYVEQLKADDIKPSILSQGVDVQSFVRQYHKKGISDPSRRDGSPREIVDAGFVVGQYWDIKERKYLDITWAKIVYSRKGAHIYPVLPREGVSK